MKLRSTTIFLFLASPLVWAQQPTPGRPAAAPTRPATATPAQPTATQPTAPAAAPPTTGAQGNNSQNAKVEGFDGTAWGSAYKDVKEKFRTMAANANPGDNVEIIADNPDREILIKRREIYYRYVFYKKPADKMVESMPKPDKAKSKENTATPETDATTGTAKFFFVESIFPLLKSEDLYAKLSQKYGQRTGSSVGDTQRGAYTWEKEEGFLVQWVEPYAKNGYTRSLYYLSRKIRDEIKSDLQAWQYVREIQALDSLLK